MADAKKPYLLAQPASDVLTPVTGDDIIDAAIERGYKGSDCMFRTSEAAQLLRSIGYTVENNTDD